MRFVNQGGKTIKCVVHGCGNKASTLVIFPKSILRNPETQKRDIEQFCCRVHAKRTTSNPELTLHEYVDLHDYIFELKGIRE